MTRTPGQGGKTRRHQLTNRTRAWKAADKTTARRSQHDHTALQGQDPWTFQAWKERRHHDDDL